MQAVLISNQHITRLRRVTSQVKYIIQPTFFPKYFLLSVANPRTVIRQEPILERYSTLSATTKPTVKKIFDAGRNGTPRIASPMVRILKKRILFLLSNTTNPDVNQKTIINAHANAMNCKCNVAGVKCVIKHREFEVGMILFVEFRPLYFSISPTQAFLGLFQPSQVDSAAP